MSRLDFIDKDLSIKNPPDFTVISTFAGCGGSSTGYVWAGGKVLLAVEWDDNAVETYRLNYPSTPVYHSDIAKLSVERCLELSGVMVGELDILDGSPPCQGFSTAGKRDFYDVRNELFHEYVRLLRGLKPKVFIMENVPGLVKGKMKLIFAEIMKELKASGYRVSCKKLNAMYFGVPQSRERLIFIGVREDLEIEPSHPKAQTRPIATKNVLIPARSFVILSYPRTLESAWHKAKYLESVSRGFADYKLHPNMPSRCIRKAGAFWHFDIPFPLNTRGYGRVASYPDGYKWPASQVNAQQRIGNSVPPRFMQAIAEHVRDEVLKPANERLAGLGLMLHRVNGVDG